jgi:indole-3-glycerol phosphate synthase|tara:strand:- start:2599 stop:3450 length:852 start_codon:yes stop_codon:yes gene_type:complete
MIENSFLKKMADYSYERVLKAKKLEPEAQLIEIVKKTMSPPPIVLDNQFNIIAEIKKRSPAKGNLQNSNFSLEQQLKSYALANPMAISILTEPEEFKGSLTDLSFAAGIMNKYKIPVMRKDFLVDPYQLLEAKKMGASGVLLITSILSYEQIDSLLSCASENHLFVLLEAFDHKDLEIINKINLEKYINSACQILCGINCRNLKTLEISFDRFKHLSKLLPKNIISVAESGIENTEHIRSIINLGFSAALIGSKLMESSNPEKLLNELITEGRSKIQEIQNCL